MKKAIVLLSGGIDSTTCLALAQSQGYQVYALSVDYGQRHRRELERACLIAQHFRVEDHRIVTVDLRALGGSSLTSSAPVPKDRTVPDMSRGIPSTYVPARNTILLGLALGFAEVVNAFDIFLGANILDYSGYPDCRPEFIHAFAHLANLATRSGTEKTGCFVIQTPLLYLSKSEIIRTGLKLGIDYSQTLSCYDPDSAGRSCGRCDSCLLRKKGFVEAGCPDPTSYQTESQP